MSYPIPVMKIAAEVNRFNYKQMETWQALYQRHENIDEFKTRLIYKAADQICHGFVSNVLQAGEVKIYDDPEGKVINFSCVALTQKQLCDLLYQAYAEGQSDGFKRAPVLYAPQPEGPPR